MNFNTILYRLGFNPNDFINEDDEPIKTSDGFIYEVRQRSDKRICPYCRNEECVVKDYYYQEVNCSETDHIKDILRIKRVRFKCKNCNKSFTVNLNGIDRYSNTSKQTINMIVKDFAKMISFTNIAYRYDLTRSRILQIFDETIKFVPRRHLPRVLCIDEIKFNEEINQKYCCVLYNHEEKEIVDIIKNRQLAYLEEYFRGIKEVERNSVQYFVSDMYDGYKTIHNKYLGSSIHIIDLFHVVTQLTRATNSLRVKAMASLNKNCIEYRFMKSHWKFFLCRKENIPDKFYTSKKTGEIYHYDDLVFRCVLKNEKLLESYNILQDLFHYSQCDSFSKSLDFIDSIIERLMLTGDETMETVAYTYKRWRIQIANGFYREKHGKHYTNGIAESLNNHLKTIIKLSYGYHNFERFRKRAMLICTYKKELE